MDALEKRLLEERLADRFAVENMEQANWALRKVGYHQRKQAEAKALADGDIDFFTGLLEEFHRKLIKADPKLKTIRLPEGTLEIRKLPPEFQHDEEGLVEWAKLKKRLQVAGGVAVDPETGEVVPGVSVVADRDIFRVKPRQE